MRVYCLCILTFNIICYNEQSTVSVQIDSFKLNQTKDLWVFKDYITKVKNKLNTMMLTKDTIYWITFFGRRVLSVYRSLSQPLCTLLLLF